MQIEWTQKEAFGDLGYDTSCTTANDPKETGALYEKILGSIPDNKQHFPLMKIAFKHYINHPILDRLIILKEALVTCENIQQNLLQAQKRLHRLQITENNDTMSTQQKQSEGR